MLIYLGLAALTVFLVTFVLLVFGEPSVLATTHLIFAVAILPLIFAAITHFVPVLTRSGGPHRGVWLAPVLLQVTGIAVVLHFSGVIGSGALQAAAGVALLVAVGFAGWLMTRARHTLGKPHPGWRWYLAGLLCLAVGLALVPAMSYWPFLRQPLRLLHLHLNTLGFIGLTALGTVQVLLPTVLSGPDAEASARLRRDLPTAVVGVLATGFGAAYWWPLSFLGAALLSYVACRIGLSWLRRYGLRTIFADGASAALGGAMCGFLLLLVLGLAHGGGWLDGRDAVPAFMVVFLLPLVSGALSQLLPVWCHPGRRTPVRDRMRERLARGGALRTLLFLGGGTMLALGFDMGLWLAGAGLLLFIFAMIRSFAFLKPLLFS